MITRQTLYLRARAEIDRLSAAAINRAAPDPERQVETVAAAGGIIPLLYGVSRVGGRVFAVGDLSGDLVIGWLWGQGPVDSITEVFITDAEVPPASGITLTHYPAGGLDPTLAAAITGYADALPGMAYTVALIEPAAVGDWPRAQAVLRGRTVYDPRDAGQDPDNEATWTYSDNPALIAADLIRSPSRGLGLTVLGVEDAADWCDELVGTDDVRCRLSLAMTRSRPTIEWIDLALNYAQCFRVWEGSVIRLIPDGPVAAVSRIVPVGQIVQNSIRRSVPDVTDLPTVVEVRYTRQTDDATPWTEVSAIEQVAGVADGSVPEIISSVHLPGVFRDGEAQRVAEQRLARLRDSYTVTWETHDPGVVDQVGDVVQLREDLLGNFIIGTPAQYPEWLRIMSVHFSGPGTRYAVTAEHYSDELYSDTTTPHTSAAGDPVTWPTGILALTDASTAPEGWTLWGESHADRFLRGADAAQAVDPGDTGGGGATGALSGTWETDGLHGTHSLAQDRFYVTTTPGGTLSALLPSSEIDVDVTDSGVWNHAGTTPVPAAWRRRLIRRTATTDAPLPQQAIVLAADALVGSDIQIVAPAPDPYNKHLLRIGPAAITAHAPYPPISISGNLPSHNHGVAGTAQAGFADTSQPVAHEYAAVSDTYTADGELELILNPRRAFLMPYQGIDGDYPLRAGMIFARDPTATEALPARWVSLTSGTPDPDLRRRCIEIVSGQFSGLTSGDDTLVAIPKLPRPPDTHDHRLNGFNGGSRRSAFSRLAAHKAGPQTSPEIAATGDQVAWAPAWLAVEFVMFTG